MNSPNPAYYEGMATARGVRPTPARSWAILLTSANHGTVGPLGSTFPHAGEHHERVVVVEVPAAAGAPSDEVNLVLRAAPEDFALAIEREVAAQAGQVAPVADMTKEQIVHRAIVELRVFAPHELRQDGQVAVPEGWKLVPIQMTDEMRDAGNEITLDRGKLVASYKAMLAAAPAAPAQAKPLPAAQAYLAAELDPAEPVCKVSDLKSAQASTAGGRQEGGQS